MIVRSVLGLGKSLEILAEGVETAQQLQFLSAEDRAQVQGFYFGRPASAHQIGKILASGFVEAEHFAGELALPWKPMAWSPRSPPRVAKGTAHDLRPLSAIAWQKRARDQNPAPSLVVASLL
jgi:hypothetical protein